MTGRLYGSLTIGTTPNKELTSTPPPPRLSLDLIVELLLTGSGGVANDLDETAELNESFPFKSDPSGL